MNRAMMPDFMVRFFEDIAGRPLTATELGVLRRENEDINRRVYFLISTPNPFIAAGMLIRE